MSRKLLYYCSRNVRVVVWEDAESKEVFLGTAAYLAPDDRDLKDEEILEQVRSVLEDCSYVRECDFIRAYSDLRRRWLTVWVSIPEEIRERLSAKYCALVL